MKRFSRCACFLLVCVMMFSTVAFAAETVEPRASNFFAASSVYFWNTSGNNYEIWFEVTSVSTMLELGTSKITVQRRANDSESWSTVKTYYKENYSQMTDANTVHHYGCVPFTATSGYSYRAIVYLYARNSSGNGTMRETTAILDLR